MQSVMFFISFVDAYTQREVNITWNSLPPIENDIPKLAQFALRKISYDVPCSEIYTSGKKFWPGLNT